MVWWGLVSGEADSPWWGGEVTLYILCPEGRMAIGEGTEASQRPLGIGTSFAHDVPVWLS